MMRRMSNRRRSLLRGVLFGQGNPHVRGAEMLGQVLAPGSLTAAKAFAGADQIFQRAPFDRVQLAQVHDRFSQVDRRGGGRQKIPAEDQTTADLVPNDAGLENTLLDQLGGHVDRGDDNARRLVLGQVAGLGQDHDTNDPDFRRDSQIERRRREFPNQDGAIVDNVALGEVRGGRLLDRKSTRLNSSHRL